MYRKILRTYKYIFSFLLTALILFSSEAVVFADVLSDRLEDVANADEVAGSNGLVDAILQLSIPAAVMSLIALFTYAGYQMITSQGNPEKLNEAREVITNAILGFLMIALSVAILLLIQDVLQLPGV
jgi:hypothetical protein